jgi:taurine dioxygenase
MGVLTTKHLTPFGVEVDFDLSNELDDQVAEELRELLWDRHLLVFRGQTFSFAQQRALMRLFGPLCNEQDGSAEHRSTSESPTLTDYVSVDPKVGAIGTKGLPFHQDLTMCPHPLLALSLFAVDVEPGTTSTMFVDSTDLYAALPADLQEQLEGVEALHVFPAHGYEDHLRSTSPGGEPVDLRLPHRNQPVILPHPVTGEKILFVNSLLTDRIVGLDDAESEELLSSIFERSYRPENVYEHVWDLGDLVVWDNLAVQHARGNQAHMTRRTLRRVVCGEAGFFEQQPEMRFAEGEDGVAASPVLAQ